MLVLSRKPGEKVRIGNDITIVVLEVKGDRVRIGFDAPAHVAIAREEIYDPLVGPFVREASGNREMHHAVGTLLPRS